MKFLKKASLAAAIAAAPFAVNAEMVALDDATMSSTTGQSGVTINIDIEGTGITVGTITYTDTATKDATNNVVADIDTDGDTIADTNSGGSVVMQNLAITNVTGLVQTIDVTENGDLFMTQSGVNGMSITLGDDGSGAYSAVALKGNGGTAELVNSLSMNLDLGNSTTTIHNLGNMTNTIDSVGIQGAHGADKSPMVIEMNSAIKINDLDVGLFGYTKTQAEGIAGVGTPQATALAAGAAVHISDLTFDNGSGGAATMKQYIWADPTGVYIQMGQINGTLTIGDIAIGNDAGGNALSVGSLSMENINLAGLTQKITGH